MNKFSFTTGAFMLLGAFGLMGLGCSSNDSSVGAGASSSPVTGDPCDNPGASVDREDGCNVCTWERGAWACTEMACDDFV